MRRIAGALLALLVLVAFQAVGTLLATNIALPIPGAVIGMVLLFVVMLWRGVFPALQRLADLLVRHLSLLFVPAAVGAMAHVALLQEQWLGILLMMFLSTTVTMAVTGLLLQWLLQRIDANQTEKNRQ